MYGIRTLTEQVDGFEADFEEESFYLADLMDLGEFDDEEFYLTDDEEEAEFRISALPSQVQDAFRMGGGAWPLAVQRAIDAGVKDINKLTDIAFFMHYPERISGGMGRPLTPSEPSYGKMIELWKFLRSGIYPLLKKPTKPSSSAGAGSGPVPAVNSPLPRSGVGFVASKPERNQFGLLETILALREIGRRWNARHPSGPPIQISDISRSGGGKFSPHSSHRIGNDVDIRFIRKDGRLGPINPLISSQKANFDKARTQDLVNIIKENGVLTVHKLWINKYIGLAHINGDEIHNDHMHVRFCVPAKYDLSAMRRAAGVSPKGTYSSCS